MRQFLSTRLRPFQHVAFRRFFLVQTISLVGTWAHDLARAWIVINLMGQAGALGSLLLATALPGLLLSLQGGVFADRFDVRRIMMATKTLLALLSLTLAFVSEFAHIQMWHLLVFGIIEGGIVAFDNPTFQALTVRMVPREDFQQAIALNSTNFHAGRMLGPIIAGGLMSLHGPSLVFLFDAISYVGLIFVLSSISLRDSQRPQAAARDPGASLLTEGLHYAWSERDIRLILAQLLLTICVVMPVMMVIFRAYLAAKFNLGSGEFGFLFMFPALGSMAGALSFTVFQPKQPLKALLWGVPLAVIGLIAVPQSPTATIAALLMSVTGFASYLSLASLTVSIHLAVAEEFRGRLSSIVGMGFSSVGPLMCFPIGLYADCVGHPLAIVSLAAVFAFGSVIIALLARRRP